MNESAWKRLRNLIRDGNVVPVVGPQLLVGSAGRQSLQRDIAERLLSQYEVETDLDKLPPLRELDAAVSQLKAVAHPQDLYADVHDIMRELTAGDAAIPPPIHQLAQITDFRLFVTLALDDPLARSLGQRLVFI